MGRRKQTHGQTANQRTARVNRLIHETLSRLLLTDVRDPRVTDVTITEVKISPDLKAAKIYYATHDKSPEEKEEIQQGLDKAKGFMRAKIGESIQLKYTPELLFLPDTALDYAQKINDLLHQAKTDNEGDEE